MNVDELKAGFDRDGFITIRGFLEGDALAELNREIDRYIAQVVPTLPKGTVLYEQLGDASTLKHLVRLTADPYFGVLLRDDRFTDLASALLADDVVPRELQWFSKPSRVGQPTPPHQDGYYFMLEPNEAITAWLALDFVDERNGCMRYIAGSHRQPVRPHTRTQTVGFSQGISYGPDDFATEVAVTAQPGDLLVHHSLTIHRADANRSERPRRSLGFVYFAARAKQEASRLAAYQESLHRDLATAGKI
ncbi:MAG TPA: phytanoyl-CoA dioxygenase family protein [Tepidisphaeraceae bacterium]|nr:phytanoyl-CoA dioxygenase family protein [Tepidisphaeraceae bacterium]